MRHDPEPKKDYQATVWDWVMIVISFLCAAIALLMVGKLDGL